MATTKYSISEGSRWRHKTGKYLTIHAQDRWDERTPTDARSPEWVFERATRARDAERLEVFREGGHSSMDTDSVWVYRGQTASGEHYGAVFVETDDNIVTVIDLDSIQHRPTRDYLRRYALLGGVVRE